MTRLRTSMWMLLGAIALGSVAPVAAQPVARHVVIVTLDGMRWQEFFSGADRDYFTRDKEGSAGEPEARFWRPSAAERRSALMPFMWNTIATQGQIFGDPAADSLAHVTNGLWFSYPGYSEMLAGVADPRIDSNRKVPNPNITVLEWLNGRPGSSDASPHSDRGTCCPRSSTSTAAGSPSAADSRPSRRR